MSEVARQTDVSRGGKSDQADQDASSPADVVHGESTSHMLWGLCGARVGEASNRGPFSSDELLIPPTVLDESHQWPAEDGSDWWDRNLLLPCLPTDSRFLLDSEGHARHAGGAATTSPVVASVIHLESDSDSQVEVASVGPRSDLDLGEGDPEVEAEVPVSSLAFAAAAPAVLVALDSVDLEDEFLTRACVMQ